MRYTTQVHRVYTLIYACMMSEGCFANIVDMCNNVGCYVVKICAFITVHKNEA